MAIIKCGGGVVGIRGNLGGNIFSANTAGAYARSWANITNQRTFPQTVQRYYWCYALPIWSDIAPEDKLLWKAYGQGHPQQNKLGEWYYLNALQWFTRCNVRLISWGGSPVSQPPTDPAPAAIVPTGLYYEPAGLIPNISIAIDPDDWTANWCIIDAMVIPHGQSMSWTAQYYRMRADFAPYTSPWSFALAHNLKFGFPQPGWQCFVRVYTGDNFGLVSAPWGTQATYPAP
jgi:hypothetical protein